MTLKSTIYKIKLSVANISAHHYEDYNLTLAKHPSENDERMMWRLVIFALHAHEDLAFGKGISDTEEPDVWLKNLDGQIESWIDLGQPDEKKIRQACGKSNRVYIYSYQLAASQIWWEGLSHKIKTHPKLKMYQLISSGETPISTLANRSMQISCTIEDNGALLAGRVDGNDVSLDIAVTSY